MSTDISNDIVDSPEKVSNLVANIFDQFFTELSKEQSLGEVATNLKDSIMEKGILTEAEIKKIIFPDTP